MNQTLVEPNHFQQLSKRPSSLEAYFSGIRSNLLIVVDETNHQIGLSFGNSPTRKSFQPIKALLSHDVCTRLKPFNKTEFTIGFGQICKLKDVACSLAIIYQNLGYQAQILCGTKLIDPDMLIGDNTQPQSLQKTRYTKAVSF